MSVTTKSGSGVSGRTSIAGLILRVATTPLIGARSW